MVKKTTLRNMFLLTSVVLLLASLAAPVAFAEAEGDVSEARAIAEDRQHTSIGEGIRVTGIALAACLAMIGGAIGTAKAQAAIGAAGAGALAEKPELFVSVLVLVALPETIVILGFVIGFLIINSI